MRANTVLDFCMGSGSTGVAAINTNRNFIGIERMPDFLMLRKSESPMRRKAVEDTAMCFRTSTNKKHLKHTRAFDK